MLSHVRFLDDHRTFSSYVFQFIDHSDWGARQSNTIENPESGDPASATSGEAAKPEKLKYFDIIDSGVKCMFIVAVRGNKDCP